MFIVTQPSFIRSLVVSDKSDCRETGCHGAVICRQT